MNRVRPRPQEKSGHRSLCHGACVQEKNHFTAPSAIQANPETARFAVEQLLLCFMRPLSLALIGLAAAVTLWGFAYKLSLYYPDQNHPAPISVAKLWLGPEGTLLISKNREKCPLQHRRTLDSVLTQQVEAPPEAYNRMLAVPDAAVAGGERFTDSPPRSPPPHMS
jgi:hypothetical protein